MTKPLPVANSSAWRVSLGISHRELNLWPYCSLCPRIPFPNDLLQPLTEHPTLPFQLAFPQLYLFTIQQKSVGLFMISIPYYLFPPLEENLHQGQDLLTVLFTEAIEGSCTQ